MTEIYLARHGQTPRNLQKEIICGQSNYLPLTSHGELQAAELGNYIAATGIDIDAVYSSTAVRAYNTAKFALDAAGISLPITQDTALLEMSQGEAEGKLRKDVYTPSKFPAIQSLGSTFSLPGAESVRTVRERKTGWVLEAEQKHPNQVLFVVGHGLATRCLVGGVLGWSLEQVRSYPTPNCSLTYLLVEDGNITVPFISKNVIEQLASD